MDVRVGDKLIMKKNHPCGSNEFAVLRIGMDFRIRCTTWLRPRGHGSARQGGEEHKTYRAHREGLAYFASRRFGGQE